MINRKKPVILFMMHPPKAFERLANINNHAYDRAGSRGKIVQIKGFRRRNS